jgi:glucose-fructose oxidoreductase
LYDLGIYGIDFIRHVTGSEPELLYGLIRRDTPEGVDMFSHAVFSISGTIATLTTGFDTDANYYALCGEKGSILARAAISGKAVENVLQIHFLDGDRLIEERFPAENPYVAELEYFANCIERHERPHPDGENALRNLQVLEDVFGRAMEIHPR